MQEPLVSVHMITYNHAPYIAQAIKCVLAQKTNFPFELVIGEDCSTDGTREIVFDYAKRYPEIIRVITSDKNIGMHKNSFRTTQACQGKYIAWCEGDDYWQRDDKLQIQADYLDTHPTCGLICSDYDTFDTATKKRINNYVKHKNWTIPENPQLTDFLNNTEVLGVAILTCTVVAVKKLIDKIQQADPFLYHEGNFLMGDTQLWAEMSTIATIYFCAESLATHNILVGSAANPLDFKQKLRFRISSSKLLIYLCDKHHMPPEIKNQHQANLQKYSLRLAFHEMNSELAEETRRNKEAFTWKEWLQYYGAKVILFHFCFRILVTTIKFISRKDAIWS